MKEMHCTDSLFGIPRYSDEAAVVTTNGVIRKNGCGVMGAGQALEAKKLFPGVEEKLGKYLKRYGNRVFNMGVYMLNGRLMSLITFPTKHHYKDNSDLELIRQSAIQLKQVADKFELTKVYLPAVGCGLGKLDYEQQVKPVLQEILDDDRFVVVLGYQNY